MTHLRSIFKPLYVLCILLFFSASIATAEASSVIRTGETVSIAEDQQIEGSFYAAAGKVNMSGSVEEDMISVGGQVTLNGEVGSDAFLLGGQVDVHGPVQDDLRIIAGGVTIAKPVVGDVFVIGGMVSILSTASVSGDVVVFGGEVIIEGSVDGNVLGTMDTLRIDSMVMGEVDVTVGQLTLGDRADIEGSVSYVSKNMAIQALNATVGDGMVHNDPVLPVAETRATSALIPILILLFSVLVWFWVSRRSLQRVTERALLVSPRPILFGFAAIVFTPVAIGILLASFIGSLIGMVLLFGYLLLITLGFVGLPAVIGQLLLHTFSRSTAHVSLAGLIIGVIGVALLMLLPVIGSILLLGFVVLTFGSVVDLFIRPKVD